MNITGTKTRLSTVDVINPPMTAIAIGARKAASAPTPTAAGTMPATMAIVVMMIGRARVVPAASRAARRSAPSLRRTIA
ncbi:hypothetical protein D3C87_1935880 [compost metagenome]